MPDAGAAERLFDERLVRIDVAQQNRDAIEGSAMFSERADAAGDFDALEAFARGGEEQCGVGRRGGRRIGREEPGADAIERCGGRRGVDIFSGDAKDVFERCDGVVA